MLKRWVFGRRYWGLVALIAAAHWLVYVGAAGETIASGEFRTSGLLATAMGVIVKTLGAPLMYLLRLPPSTFGSTRWWGDDTNFIFALAGLNALVWGVALASTGRWWLSAGKRPDKRLRPIAVGSGSGSSEGDSAL